ncbi:hypothetical protein MVEG_00270 [Podila verticillata NRRL 6337]|nr:hypothetical protein MVEG_00270 [Podila verticillata NRRL 6337]
MLAVILAVVISAFLFSALFYYLFKVYKRLQIRHAKPLPNAIPPGLEEHHELAFVLAHGVEAYNQLRRQRQQRQERPADDNASTASSSSHPSISAAAAIEPPPAYTASPVDGDVGYGWRASGQTSIFGPPQVITSSSRASIPDSLPPVYIYQSPTTRSSVQTALLTSDNSPVVSVGHRPNMRRISSRGETSGAPVGLSGREEVIAEGVEDGEQLQHGERIVAGSAMANDPSPSPPPPPVHPNVVPPPRS